QRAGRLVLRGRCRRLGVVGVGLRLGRRCLRRLGLRRRGVGLLDRVGSQCIGLQGERVGLRGGRIRRGGVRVGLLGGGTRLYGRGPGRRRVVGRLRCIGVGLVGRGTGGVGICLCLVGRGGGAGGGVSSLIGGGYGSERLCLRLGCILGPLRRLRLRPSRGRPVGGLLRRYIVAVRGGVRGCGVGLFRRGGGILLLRVRVLRGSVVAFGLRCRFGVRRDRGLIRRVGGCRVGASLGVLRRGFRGRHLRLVVRDHAGRGGRCRGLVLRLGRERLGLGRVVLRRLTQVQRPRRVCLRAGVRQQRRRVGQRRVRRSHRGLHRVGGRLSGGRGSEGHLDGLQRDA